MKPPTCGCFFYFDPPISHTERMGASGLHRELEVTIFAQEAGQNMSVEWVCLKSGDTEMVFLWFPLKPPKEAPKQHDQMGNSLPELLELALCGFGPFERQAPSLDGLGQSTQEVQARFLVEATSIGMCLKGKPKKHHSLSGGFLFRDEPILVTYGTFWDKPPAFSPRSASVGHDGPEIYRSRVQQQLA